MHNTYDGKKIKKRTIDQLLSQYVLYRVVIKFVMHYRCHIRPNKITIICDSIIFGKNFLIEMRLLNDSL